MFRPKEWNFLKSLLLPFTCGVAVRPINSLFPLENGRNQQWLFSPREASFSRESVKTHFILNLANFWQLKDAYSCCHLQIPIAWNLNWWQISEMQMATVLRWQKDASHVIWFPKLWSQNRRFAKARTLFFHSLLLPFHSFLSFFSLHSFSFWKWRHAEFRLWLFPGFALAFHIFSQYWDRLDSFSGQVSRFALSVFVWPLCENEAKSVAGKIWLLLHV